MHEFRTRKEGFTEIRNRILFMLLFMTIFMVIIVIITLQGPGAAQTAFVIVPVLLAVLGLSTYNSIRKQRVIYDSIVIRIDDEKIERSNSAMPTITIPRSEITKVTHNSNGSITIVGKSTLNAIGIPAMMENQEQLHALIAEMNSNPTKASAAGAQGRVFLALIAGAGLWLLSNYSSNELVRLIASLPVIGLFAWFFYVVRNSKNIDRRTRNLSWVALLPALAAVFEVWRYFSR